MKLESSRTPVSVDELLCEVCCVCVCECAGVKMAERRKTCAQRGVCVRVCRYVCDICWRTAFLEHKTPAEPATILPQQQLPLLSLTQAQKHHSPAHRMNGPTPLISYHHHTPWAPSAGSRDDHHDH